LQVVQGTTSTSTTISTSTLTDSGLTATITPSSATSKILVIVAQQIYNSISGAGVFCAGQIVRGGTSILNNSYVGGSSRAGASGLLEHIHTWSPVYLDSPSTTSATTYKTQLANNNTGTIEAQAFSSSTSTIILMEIGA
jgi:DNA/RNA endonuclease YhcR with UshA esterase domain